MTAFLLATLALLGVATAFVVWPLWRTEPVLSEVVAAPRRGAAIGLGAALVPFTALMYAMVGTPAALLPQAPTQPQALAPAPAQVNAGQGPAGSGAGGMTPAQIEGMVARLAQRLQQQPEDVAGWRMLVRSYETLGRYPQAVDAWRRLLALQPDDPDLLVDYAVTLGMSQGQSLAGEPESALNQALRLNPTHVQALALSGSAAFERADYARAIAQWRRILANVPPDAEVRASIEGHIARAEALAARGQTEQGRP